MREQNKGIGVNNLQYLTGGEQSQGQLPAGPADLLCWVWLCMHGW